jgi:serine/threonine-protein kinase SRPK3
MKKNSSTNSTNSSNSDSDCESDCDSESSDYADEDLGDEYYGMILDNRYIILHKIGLGGFASVWLSYYMNDPKKQYYYAIKIQNPEYYSEAKIEVDTYLKISNIKSEYLINMIEHFKFKPLQSKKYAICMVFELMACSLYQLIRRGKYKKGLPPELVYNISLQIIEGLKDIHKKLKMIHTDIKPENILIKGYEKNIKKIINEIDKYNLSNMYKEMLDNEKNIFLLSLKKKNNIKKLKQIVKNKMKDKVISLMEQIKQNIDNELEDNRDSENESEKELEDEDLNNIKVVISDFGSIRDLNDYNKKEEIQTRYYRAPEIVLKCNFDERCDIWSLGCSIYEILTGDILFNPEKDGSYSRDFHHIYWFYEICGDIPKWMIEKSDRKKEFFNKNGSFLAKKPEAWNIKEIIKEEKKIDNEKLDKVIFLIDSMLKINPNERNINF